MIECIPVGATVYIGLSDESIEGCVIAVSIHAGGRVRYQVAWWNGRARNEAWIEEVEVFHKPDQEMQRIGFRP